MAEFNIKVDVNEIKDINAIVGFNIMGVEVTQSIQYYDSASHMTNANDRGRDNSVALVMGKPVLIRVYLSAGMFSGNIHGVTGTCELFQKPVLKGDTPYMTLYPQSFGSSTAFSLNFWTYDQWRSSLGNTLNFIIPTRKFAGLIFGDNPVEKVCGAFVCKITLKTPDGRTASTQVDVDLTEHKQLRLAGIMLAYNGPPTTMPPPNTPNLNLAAPTLADLRTTAAGFALRAYPISTASYRAITPSWSQSVPLNDAVPANDPGGCSPNWNNLIRALQTERTNDGNRSNTIYFGLLPLNTPIGTVPGTNSGCGDDGVGAAVVGDSVTLGHEMGHACGLKHAPCGTSGSKADSNFPTYEPYTLGSIGEYGVDVSADFVFRPTPSRDVMGYCPGQQWVSLYHYEKLLNADILESTHPCPVKANPFDLSDYYVPGRFSKKWLPDPPPDRAFWSDYADPSPVISIIGIVHGEREIEVTSVMRVSANPQVSNGQSTDLRAMLVNDAGQIVARAPLYRLRRMGCGCGCGCDDDDSRSAYPYAFQAYVSDVERGAMLQITRETDELWSIKPGAEPPRVGDVRAEIMQTERFVSGWALMIDFRYESTTETRPECWLQYSNDDGRNWFGLTAGVRDNQVLVDGGSFPAGVILIRVLVSDGFETSTSDPVYVEIPQRAPDVVIYSPRPDEPIRAGAEMRLWGSVIGANGDDLDEQYAMWILDGQEIAQGTDTYITAPDFEGVHSLILVGRDQYGTTERTVTFTTIRADEQTF